ncbi:lysM and putative peptidoglycan-binding domain-containing protein 3 isoform X2 [Ochlerotatus camptorhynchus]|uniref:lysM and putative peptidoglycan-binding domain-containing protein 3 isoform X2 n=1 Tax=Ochlerotatus camptorhynchus TaxID=644619 RepID=UPI0031DF801F
MKRQRVKNVSSRVYVDHQFDSLDPGITLNEAKTNPIEKWMEAQVLPGDTLQAIALRFNCTIAELKKINKIDKDNEIFARRIIRVPITPHSVLLETLPKVHSSGNSSPKSVPSITHNAISVLATQANLDEKLIVAAVSSASYKEDNLNHIVLNARNETHASFGDPQEGSSKSYRDDNFSSRQPLLSGEYDENVPQPRPVRLPASDFSCNGSDCDISWICLLVCILALCFAIPLIYVFYVAEHPEKYHHNHDTEPRIVDLKKASIFNGSDISNRH